ncbi:tRNA (adenine-N(1)-)-methyltransferase catalytic subunit trm61 [Actinomortierella ambigua]|uniref:tRNA (adenine(58)-N(1))-methyltransferase catalytic subunit TRM61 n=1 Tax=Actinomortierella ambigua TaxID=1343610 RepID=A0A9P6PYU6_9FUNG|nr:tRNA (adenine-N(1)-)-methyltransferase catalytic subunit trm61 [Actinomortierella ambigua]
MSLVKQSFATYKESNTIEYGDWVIMYLSRDTMQLVQVKEGGSYVCKFGKYKHADMVGLEYGTKMASYTGRGFLYLLYPTPELWTQVLPHRTQILYVADISFVMAYLNLKPGMKMIESGTGSGSFSHSIVRTLAPTGHLYTFEYHQERVTAAQKEFEEHGLSHLVTLQCQDVCRDGFGLENEVDAVFLDLPAPWDAVASAKKAFRQDSIGKICTFSPCIEQISRTVTALGEHGFVDIQMYECLIRYNELRLIPMWTIDEAIEKQRSIERKRRRPHHTRTESDTPASSDGERGAKHARTEGDAESQSSSMAGTPAASTPGSEVSDQQQQQNPQDEESRKGDTPAVEGGSAEGTWRQVPKNVLVSRLPDLQRGHTSYLLFATFTPTHQQPSLSEKTATS